MKLGLVSVVELGLVSVVGLGLVSAGLYLYSFVTVSSSIGSCAVCKMN